MMPATLEVVTTTIVALARLALFGYAISAGKTFLLAFLESRKGLPIFATPHISAEIILDAARKAGLDLSQLTLQEKV